MTIPLIMRLMASSVSAASTASNIIRKVLASGRLDIVYKGVNDMQTQADRSAQHCIVSSLSKKFPGLCIIGEENLSEKIQPFSELVEESDSGLLTHNCPPSLTAATLDDVVVWVDPLDGTGELAKGFIQHVTVLIGVAVKGRPVGGVICQPFHLSGYEVVPWVSEHITPEVEQTTPRLIWGLEGLGIFGSTSRPISQAPLFENTTDPNANLIVGSRCHHGPSVETVIKACKPSNVFSVGGCGFKMLMLLRGEAHAYVCARTSCKRWDTCAPEALLNTIGGLVTDINGDPYSYDSDVDPHNSMGLLAVANSDWHSAYLKRIPYFIL